MSVTLRIHPELERNLRALTDDERAELERSILAEGCRDAIVVWQEEDTILDGHNRFRICKEQGVPFEVVRISLPSLEAALAWQVRNQFAKRNLTPQEIAYYRGKDYLAADKRQGQRTDLTSGQNDQKSTTGEDVAKRHGVGERTVRRDATFADAVDALAGALGDEVRTQILTGDAPLSKQDVVTLVRAVADEPEVGKTAVELLLGEEPGGQSRLNPHGVRDPGIAILLARIRQESGELTYLQLFEQVDTGKAPLVRHDRTQLEFILSCARKGEPDEDNAELVAAVGSRYKLLYSEAQLMYLVRLGDSGVSDEDMAEIVRRAKRENESIYTAARRYRNGAAWRFPTSTS